MSAATTRFFNGFVDVRVRTREDVGDECGVCLSAFCDSEQCNKSAVETSCCLQGICAACFSTLATRCSCAPVCRQIIFTCPFCRAMSRASALDVFLGIKKTCKSCKENVDPVNTS